MHTEPMYPQRFFDEIREGSLRSAQAVVPLLMEIFEPRSVVDVGCGLGTWLGVFRQYDVNDIVGVDGEYVDRDALDIPSSDFVPLDLTQPLRFARTFDLAISLEVAEHLPAGAAAGFIKSLTELAPAIVFSAAIPEQDGTNHVNTQWPDYWRDLFGIHGFDVVDCLRPQIWENDDIGFWYRQNMLVFARPEVVDRSPTLRAERALLRPLSVVHPKHWLQVNHQAQVDREALATALTALTAAEHALARRPRLVYALSVLGRRLISRRRPDS
jgi:SAM-dependent methyltransferase